MFKNRKKRWMWIFLGEKLYMVCFLKEEKNEKLRKFRKKYYHRNHLTVTHIVVAYSKNTLRTPKKSAGADQEE